MAIFGVSAARTLIAELICSIGATVLYLSDNSSSRKAYSNTEKVDESSWMAGKFPDVHPVRRPKKERSSLCFIRQPNRFLAN